MFQDCSELVQHHLPLVADASSPNKERALGKIVVTMVFRPVASVGRASPDCHVSVVGRATALSAAPGGVATVKGGGGFKLTNRSEKGIQEGELWGGRGVEGWREGWGGWRAVEGRWRGSMNGWGGGGGEGVSGVRDGWGEGVGWE